ncbi:hypothetical protein D3C79_626350 [compost metagenome]
MATTLAAGEYLQVVGVVEAAAGNQAKDHDHHPRAGAGNDQHGKGRYALHEVEGEAANEDEANRQHADQQRSASTAEQAREHAGHVQAGAIQRGGAGGHAADHRNQAHRQEEPAWRYRQQAAHIIVGGDVVRRLGGDQGGRTQAEQERNQRRPLCRDHCQHDACLGGFAWNVARPVAQEGAK